MGRIFNKMYIVSGGVTGEDKLSAYRFQTKKMLDTTPKWGYVCPLFDEALEVDSTGHKVEYEKASYDAYWTTWNDTQMKDLVCCRVAKINENWEYLAIDPFFPGSVDDYLRGQGYIRKIGAYGTGWYDEDHKPPFKPVIFTAIHDYLKLEWDFKRNRHAGIVPNMEKDELTIYTGESSGYYDEEIGHINVEGRKVIIELDGKTYSFDQETDQDFIDFVKLCQDSTSAMHEATSSTKHDKDTEFDEWLAKGNARQLARRQEQFGKIFKEYAEGQ